jgi:hypothetical protein
VVALTEHFEVENQYTLLLEEHKQKIEDEGDFELDDKMQAMFSELDLCLSDSTRTVARLLKVNPLVVRRKREICAKRSASSLEFINTFARLRSALATTTITITQPPPALRSCLYASTNNDLAPHQEIGSQQTEDERGGGAITEGTAGEAAGSFSMFLTVVCMFHSSLFRCANLFECDPHCRSM